MGVKRGWWWWWRAWLRWGGHVPRGDWRLVPVCIVDWREWRGVYLLGGPVAWWTGGCVGGEGVALFFGRDGALVGEGGKVIGWAAAMRGGVSFACAIAMRLTSQAVEARHAVRMTAASC